MKILDIADWAVYDTDDYDGTRQSVTPIVFRTVPNREEMRLYALSIVRLAKDWGVRAVVLTHNACYSSEGYELVRECILPSYLLYPLEVELVKAGFRAYHQIYRYSEARTSLGWHRAGFTEHTRPPSYSPKEKQDPDS